MRLARRARSSSRPPTRVADRLAAVKPLGRNWEDVPYLSGALLLAGEIERDRPGAGAPLVSRVEAAIGSGDPVVTHGDYAGYAQAALDLYAMTPLADESATRCAPRHDRRAARFRPTRPPDDPGRRAPDGTVVGGRRLRRPLLAGRPLHAAARAGQARLVARRAACRRRGSRPRLRVDRGLRLRPPPGLVRRTRAGGAERPKPRRIPPLGPGARALPPRPGRHGRRPLLGAWKRLGRLRPRDGGPVPRRPVRRRALRGRPRPHGDPRPPRPVSPARSRPAGPPTAAGERTCCDSTIRPPRARPRV